MGKSDSFENQQSINSTAFVDRTSIAKAVLSGDGNQPNQILTLTQQRSDTGLVITPLNQIINSIGGDFVTIDVSEYFRKNQSNQLVRINPELELLKNGVVVAASASGYQRHGSGHRSSSNAIAYTDHAPSVGDIYLLRAQQGSNQNDVLTIDLGHITVKVTEKIEVFIV